MEEASSETKSSQGTSFHNYFQRSLSPSAATPPKADCSARSEHILTRSTSPARVTLNRSVRFSASLASHHQNRGSRSLNPSPRRTCMCSPTSHPGSFRCSLHKNRYGNNNQRASFRSSHQLNMRRSAMTNSLVRIGTVEGDLVKRALAALIRPSSHNLRRRAGFQPRPSRLSIMSKAN